MFEHLYECPSPPNEGRTIVTPDMVQTWMPGSQVIPGSIWCWRHACWETIPQAWRDRESLLRDGILREWDRVRQRPLRVTRSLRTQIMQYCVHAGRRAPDFGERCDVFRFIDRLKRRV